MISEIFTVLMWEWYNKIICHHIQFLLTPTGWQLCVVQSSAQLLSQISSPFAAIAPAEGHS